MIESPKIVTRTRRVAAVEPSFGFNAELIPLATTELRREYRQRAWDAYQRLPLPTVKDEAWRRTDIHSLPVDRLKLAGAYANAQPVPFELLKPIAGDEHGGQVVLTAGDARVSLSSELAAKGVVFTDLKTAENQYPDLVDRLAGSIVRVDESKFSALTGALAQSGILLYVPKGVHVEQPLHSLLWGPGANLAYFSHILVWVDDGASVTYVHESSSPTPNQAGSPTEVEGQSMHGGIIEIYVGAGSNLRFVELQSWGEHVWNFTHDRVQVGQDGNLEWIFGSIGSHLTKNFSDLDLVGRGATGKMSGFYFADHDQHLDHDTQQNHLAAKTTSDLLFKGALLGRSRSVWQGMIYVAPQAMKTDGYQANRNLVLSPKARADSIPGLEILTDDVRCTHGATVGKVDPEQVFYLLSRGIPAAEARRLIVEGFFDPIMQRIPFEGVRQRFQLAIHEKMEARKNVE
jgi:Fe-S cluster assembly protein SufD